MKIFVRFLTLIAIASVGAALMTISVRAGAFSASNQCLDVTCYPEVTCIPFSFNHTANVKVSAERTGSNSWKAWNHSHGGSIYMRSTFCGYSNWLRKSSYWEDSTGQKTIYRSATDFGEDCVPRSSGTHTLTITP